MNSDSIILSFIFLSHLFLNCWAILAFMNSTYLLYNVFFLVSLLWCVHETRSSAPVFVALLLNLMAIVMDAFMIGILWWNGRHYTFVISVLASIVNMLYRLLTSLIIYQIMNKRRQMDTNSESFQSATKDLITYLNFRPNQTSTARTTTTTSNGGQTATVTTTHTTQERTIHLP